MTPEPSRRREVRAAIAARTVSGRRDRVLGAVVLAERDDVDADLVGQDGLLDDLPDRGGVRDELAVGALRAVAERVQAELEGGHESAPRCVSS